MSGINKHSFPGLILGIAFGFTISGVVYAAQVTNPDFVSGNQLNAAHMNNIKSAVNDNDTRLGTAETNITNLRGNAGTSTCVTNNASDVMTRVGPLCVDTYPASLWSDKTATATEVTVIPGGCMQIGTSCSGIVAQSRANPGGALKDGTFISWARAAIACANAGKRLLTAGEWMTARAAGVTTLASGNAEFVDSMYENYSVGKVIGSPYIRNSIGLSDYIISGENVPYNTFPGGPTTFGFRCAR